MSKTDKNIYCVYIGTTKVVFLKAKRPASGEARPISGRPAPGKVEAAALSARLADGFERGIVKDLSRASQTLAKAVQDVLGPEAETMIPCRLVVSNAYLKNYTFQSSVYFNGNPHPMTLKDVRAAIAQTRSVATIPLEEVIVQAVPQEFMVNDLAGVQNPIGLEARRLGVTLRLLALDFLVHSNLLQVFERCDLEVTDVIPSVLSAAHAVLTPAEKQSGVILAVLGGAVTHFACYKNSVLLETRSLPFGAEGITEAIAKKLNIDHLDAQKLKETFGSAVSKTEFQEELIPIPDANGRKKYHIQRKEFEAQMSFGLNAYFEEIKREIKTLQGLYAPLTQVVFTGGGARLDGFLEAVQESISPMCRMGTVQGISGPEGLVSNPAFSGVLGGIDFTARLSERGLSPSLRQSWLGRSVETAKNWIFEYL